MNATRPGPRERERGQILVLFALSAVAIISMVGLVLDGGGTFAQRRDEQNGSDLASLAGANAYMNATSKTRQRGPPRRSLQPAALRPRTGIRMV